MNAFSLAACVLDYTMLPAQSLHSVCATPPYCLVHVRVGVRCHDTYEGYLVNSHDSNEIMSAWHTGE